MQITQHQNLNIFFDPRDEGETTVTVTHSSTGTSRVGTTKIALGMLVARLIEEVLQEAIGSSGT